MYRPRILIAEDHAPLRSRIAERLCGDYDVVGAVADGAAALRAVGELAPDVALLDVALPDVSGLDVAREIEASGATTRVVFVTSDAEPEVVRACFATGGSAVVLEAQLAGDLEPAIREVLAGGVFVSRARPPGTAGGFA